MGHIKLYSQRGMTVAEVLVVICLLAVLSRFFLQCFVFVQDQYRHRIALLELEDNISISLEWLERDLLASIGVSSCSQDSLTLAMPDGMVYYTVGTDTQAKEHFYELKGKILYRRESTQKNRQPLTNFISRFYVTYYDKLGNKTTDVAKVCAVQIVVEGTWKDTVLTQQLAARWNDSDYL